MKKASFSHRSDFADEGLSENDPEFLIKQVLKENDQMKVTWIKVLEEENPFHKKIGDYVTIQFDKMDDALLREKISEQVVDILTLMSEEILFDKILVVGLGNEEMISDAIGPNTIASILVSAHLFELESRQEGIRNCAAIAPKVMGQTGLESAKIVKSICDFYEPDLVLVVDALASDHFERINRVIQITNTGISPGSGVGNHRLAIDQELLQVPVISLGVATVTTIEAIVLEALKEKIDLNYQHLNCIVTPRSMDVDAKQIVSILAHALNCFIHPLYESL